MNTVCLALGLLAPHAGQSALPSESLTQAIVGVKIEVGDGTVVAKGNIVIRDGIIVAVGADVKVPASAEVLDGAGLTAFPGFIDGYTNGGLKLPPAAPDQDNTPNFTTSAPASMREANRKGITPEIHASRYLNLTEDYRKAYWEAGFTTAMIAPGSANLAGYGTLVNLGGRAVRDSVVVESTGMDCGLARTQNSGIPNALEMYPATILGSIAQTRQTFLDAQWLGSVTASYKAGSPSRPPADPSLEALTPVLGREEPVLFSADTKNWVERSLMVASEFRLRPILVGAREAWKQVDRIKAEKLPVILSLQTLIEPAPVKTKEDDPEPKDQTTERQRQFLEQQHNAAILANAGIPFSFSTKDSKNVGEFMASLRRAVKEGLPRAVALKALTIEPATLYGVGRVLGTIQPGKVANIAVLTGDFLDEKVKTKMIYIDGRRIDPAHPSASAPKPAATRGGE